MEETTLTIEEIAEINPEAMLADGFDDAILGMCIQFGGEPLVYYDYEKCIKIESATFIGYVLDLLLEYNVSLKLIKPSSEVSKVDL